MENADKNHLRPIDLQYNMSNKDLRVSKVQIYETSVA